jgi:hypothetical protein
VLSAIKRIRSSSLFTRLYKNFPKISCKNWAKIQILLVFQGSSK